MTDDPAHADNSDDYVGHNTPMKNGRDSSTPALLKTRHSSPTALDASVDAVAVRGVAEATRRGASGRSGLVGEDRAAGLLRNGFTDLLRVVAEFHGQIGRAQSELQSLMRISYAVFCLKKKQNSHPTHAE